jgi:hypothetical protein
MSTSVNSARHKRIRPTDTSSADDGRQAFTRPGPDRDGVPVVRIATAHGRRLARRLSSAGSEGWVLACHRKLLLSQLGDQVAQMPIHWLCQGRCR